MMIAMEQKYEKEYRSNESKKERDDFPTAFMCRDIMYDIK